MVSPVCTVQYFRGLHRTCCIGQRKERMIGDLPTFQMTRKSREMMATSDIDCLHVTVDIRAMLQLAASIRHHSSSRSPLVARIALVEMKIADQQGLCVESYHVGLIMAYISLHLQLFLLANL